MSIPEGQIRYEFGGFRLEPGRRELLDADGKPVAVRAKVFDTLLLLVEHAGRLVSKDELLRAVWPNAVVEENNLNQTISALRLALGDDRQAPQFIATVTGRGYQFIANVRTHSPMRDAAPIDWTLDLAPAVLLTDRPGSHSQPTPSPDGSMIAFVSDDAAGTEQIWVQGLSGDDPIQITRGPQSSTFPSWSPRNDAILFQRQSESGDPAIWRVDPLGASKPRLLIQSGMTPSFSANGESIVYAVGRQIWLANADGSGRRQVEGVPMGPGFEARRSPALSPDGKTIAFIHAVSGPSGDVWLIPAEGGQAARLADPSESSGVALAMDPEWSSDGRFVIFSALLNTSVSSHLWRLSVDSGKREQLTSGVGVYGQPVMSRDGSRLFYTNKRPIWRLIRTDPNTQTQTTLYESRHTVTLPTLSADGRRIAYFSDALSGMQIFSIETDGTNRRQWTFNRFGLNTLPVWSADRDAIYYYKDTSLHRIDLSHGASTEVAPDFHWSSRNWLAVHGDRIVFREFGIEPNVVRTVVRDLADGAELELPVTFSPTDWSRDGSVILGFSEQRDSWHQIVLCPATGEPGRTLSGESGPVIGQEPRFSSDESRIFFRRESERRDFSEMWVVDTDGSNESLLFRFGPLDVEVTNSLYGVTENDEIVWNQYDRDDTEEIWMVDLKTR